MTLPGVPKPTVTTQKTTSKPVGQEAVLKEPRLVDNVAVGDQLVTVRVVKEKRETAEGWVLIFEDGTSESFERSGAPAVMVVP